MKRALPHPLALMTACILLAGVLTHIVPAGKYERREDPASGREMVVPGTYARVDPNPLGPLEIALAVPKGLIDAADVLAVVFLGGAAFVVVEKTGALTVALAWLIGRLRRRETLAIPIIALVFATMGALENMQEEIIALAAPLVLLSTRLGFPPVIAVAMSFGAAAVGAAFSPINPFQVAIAQQASAIPMFSGAGFRSATLVIALGLWMAGTMRFAARHRVPAVEEDRDTSVPPLAAGRSGLVLLGIAAAFTMFVTGLVKDGWGFNELSALLFVAGVFGGLVGRLGINGTADAFVQGFRDMAFAALLIGFARAIFVALNEGLIIDTIVHGLFAPLANFPRPVAAVGMMAAQAVVHVPVPSVSGQAVLTMPILAPLSDLLGISRQVAVLAYQFGAGLCELFTPTNGALMAILAAARVRYEDWLTFVFPMWLVLSAFGAAAIVVAIGVGLQ